MVTQSRGTGVIGVGTVAVSWAGMNVSLLHTECKLHSDICPCHMLHNPALHFHLVCLLLQKAALVCLGPG